MQAIIVQRIDQRLQHVFLAHHFAESTGSPSARQSLVGH
jgi:hypothetical protein